MDTELPVSLVFLDTSVYVGENFSFSGHLFSTLKSRIERRQSRLVTTRLTIQEVEAQIAKLVSEADQSMQKARRQSKILRNSRNPSAQGIFADLDREQLGQELTQLFFEFLSKFDVEVIEYEEIDVAQVFGLYFAKRAPFGDAKKKHEFPDAFTLKFIELYAEGENDLVHVVSTDEDMRQGIENFNNLVRHDSLADLLSVLAFKYDKLAPLCAEAFSAVEKSINETLVEQFSDKGFVLDDQTGEVDEVFDVEVEPYEPKLLRVDHGEHDDVVSCEFEIITSINFSAQISYDDLATASYDSEDKVLIPWNTITETVESYEVVIAHVTLSFEQGNLSYVEVEEVSLGLSDLVRVSSSENDNWYK